MRSVGTLVGLSLAAAVAVPRMSAQMHALPPAPTMMAAQPLAAPAESESASSNSRSVTVRPGPNGHFEVQGRVDGRVMRFMVDTGASVIALNQSDAASLGIHPTPRDFAALIRTANGTVRAAPTRLRMVEIEDLVVRDVDAVILPDSALSDNLLGLSFLSRLARFEYSDGQLVLEQ